MPGIVGQLHVHQDVPRIELAGGEFPLPLDHLFHRLRGDQDLFHQVPQAPGLSPLHDGVLDLLFKPRVGMDDVPLFGHGLTFLPQWMKYWTRRDRRKSTSPRYAPIKNTRTRTTPVVPRVSLRLGQVTFFSS